MDLITTIKRNKSLHHNEKPERNAKIVKDFNEMLVLDNHTWADLIGKYRLSKTRILSVLDYYVPLKELEEYGAEELDDYTKELVDKYLN